MTLVGHSMGSAQILRYLSRYHADRVARVALVTTTLPFLRQTDDNADGVERTAFEETVTGVGDERPWFAPGVADLWFGNGLPGVAVSAELQQWLIGLFLQASPRADVEMFRAFTHTDFRPDLPAVEVPTLVVHGDSDAMSPFQVSARPTAAAIPHSQLKLYQHASHGLFVSHKHRLNADLIEFIKR